MEVYILFFLIATSAALPLEKETIVDGRSYNVADLVLEVNTTMPEYSSTNYEDDPFSSFVGNGCPTGKVKVLGVCAYAD
ncbi:unnamed protein product [Danaus chrysippus]|uniref:(African queen) hypothetical protein n=1 Tax=Danaus chrysippus TaxID=151541 RepID=A0A8J2W4X8_9NEOP|nr:unnamed protein product [Danaus chrysippus]